MTAFLRLAPFVVTLAALPLIPESALACSPLPEFSAELTPVAQARAAGPFIFFLQCQGETETSACSNAVPALRVVKSGSQGGDVPGVVSFLDVRLADQNTRLVSFTPDAPLDDTADYQAVMVDGSEWDEWSHFGVVAAGPATPLASAVARETWISEDQGTQYSCPNDAREQSEDSCGYIEGEEVIVEP